MSLRMDTKTDFDELKKWETVGKPLIRTVVAFGWSEMTFIRPKNDPIKHEFQKNPKAIFDWMRPIPNLKLHNHR